MDACVRCSAHSFIHSFIHSVFFSSDIYVTMKTGGFSCGKESLLREVIHSEKLNGAFRRAEAELP